MIMDFGMVAHATGNVLKNNAITNNKYYGISNNANLIYDYNGFSNNGKDYSFGSPAKNDIFGSPHYIDEIHHDYRIRQYLKFYR